MEMDTMSDATVRMPLVQARELAEEVAVLLLETPVRIEIAGSIRRGKATIGDLEIVAQVDDTPHFDQHVEDYLRRGYFVPRLNKNGTRIGLGNRFKALVYKGMALDLFIVRPDRQWGPTFLIRTGPGEANKLLVTQRTKGGVLPDDMKFDGGMVWHNDEVLDTPEEDDVYAAIGLPFVPPDQRSINAYRKLAGTRQRVLKTLRNEVEETAQQTLFDMPPELRSPEAPDKRAARIEAERVYMHAHCLRMAYDIRPHEAEWWVQYAKRWEA
jgi:DNA polymerase/3'-5' exonuclease PolX